jgi:hypothetical protein
MVGERIDGTAKPGDGSALGMKEKPHYMTHQVGLTL